MAALFAQTFASDTTMKHTKGRRGARADGLLESKKRTKVRN